MKSIFTKIIDREIPSEIIYETEHVIVIKDIHPQAPIHLLIIIKKQIPNLQSIKLNDLYLIQEVVKAAQITAQILNVNDYRLVTNNGELSGQTIFHLHFHFLAGRELKGLA